jgi:hypothetical protein
MDNRAFYLEQARACKKAAAEANLVNERAKFLAAQRAWEGLAQDPNGRLAKLKDFAAERGIPFS